MEHVEGQTQFILLQLMYLHWRKGNVYRIVAIYLHWNRRKVFLSAVDASPFKERYDLSQCHKCFSIEM